MVRRAKELLQAEGYRLSELDVARGLDRTLAGLGRRDCAEVLPVWMVLYKDAPVP